MESESTNVRDLVVQSVQSLAALLERPEIAERWDEPSALAGMTIGALAAHSVRAAGATLAYLDRTDPEERPDGDVLSPITYFHFAVDSPIHDRIKEVSADESRLGPADTATKCRTLASELRERLALEPADRLVHALEGRMITLDDFCRTRLIEVLTHLDDLAASLGEDPPPVPRESLGIIIDIELGIARHVHGDWNVIRSLSRAERVETPVFPVF